MKEINELMEVKPDIIALDATHSLRPGGRTLDEFYREIRKSYPEQLLMADCSTAVSYTHLDVYKRQAPDCQDTQSGEPQRF